MHTVCTLAGILYQMQQGRKALSGGGGDDARTQGSLISSDRGCEVC